LINYLSNALRYSGPDSPITVGLSVVDPAGESAIREARVWVRDEGPGLSVEEQERIWERFYRGERTTTQLGSNVGLGLGLTICRSIVARHRGRVGVESAPGAGSTFWFTLPLG
jgi:signal transduction histidine kinase